AGDASEGPLTGLTSLARDLPITDKIPERPIFFRSAWEFFVSSFSHIREAVACTETTARQDLRASCFRTLRTRSRLPVGCRAAARTRRTSRRKPACVRFVRLKRFAANK